MDELLNLVAADGAGQADESPRRAHSPGIDAPAEAIPPHQVSRGGQQESLTESEIRELLRSFARKMAAGDVVGVVEEFWVPTLHARADLVTVGSELHAYEIKSDADTLKRLPAQVAGFSALFDRCSLVVAPRHLDRALKMVPLWWGVAVAGPGREVTGMRSAGKSPDVNLELVVRLMWREEVMSELVALQIEPEVEGGRAGMWQQLLDSVDAPTLRAMARRAIANRSAWRGTNGSARISVDPAPAG